MAIQDPLGDRMKALERATAGAAIPATSAIYVRLDGRGFSRFTRDMARPFDARMTAAMRATAEHLLTALHPRAAYVQSDEVSLLWAPAIKEDGTPGEHVFGGKPMKITSVLAGLATAAFTRAVLDDSAGLSAWAERLPHFDARVVEMADTRDAVAAFAWRGQDARRNGIRQLASAHFSHRTLQQTGNREVVGMLADMGLHLADQPAAALNGTLLRRVPVTRPLTDDERLRIPPAHRPGPGTQVTRTDVAAFDDAHPGRISNLDAVLLSGADPQVASRAKPVADRAGA